MEIGAGFSVGRVAYYHDMRIGKLPKNIDPSRIKDDIILVDNLKGKTIEQFVDQGMQKWIDDYNKDKKPCRQIKTTYTEWHKSQKKFQQGNKTEFAFEVVLSYGGKDDIGKLYQNPQTREKIREESKELFTKWLSDIKEQYPHLRVVYSVLHYSESTPHMHLCLLPLSTDYKRGPKTQICLSRALEQDGIEKITDTKEALEQGGFQLTRFYKKFRHEVMNEDLRNLGYTIKEEEHGKKHIDSKIYGDIATALENTKLLTESLQKAEELERSPVYEPSTIKRIQHKESVLSKTEELIAMPESTFLSLKASADAQKLALETKDRIKQHKKVIDHFLDNIQPTNREERLTRENENLRAKIKEQEFIISSLKTKQEQFKQRIIRFLQKYLMIDIFKEYIKQLAIEDKIRQHERIIDQTEERIYLER